MPRSKAKCVGCLRESAPHYALQKIQCHAGSFRYAIACHLDVCNANSIPSGARYVLPEEGFLSPPLVCPKGTCGIFATSAFALLSSFLSEGKFHIFSLYFVIGAYLKAGQPNDVCPYGQVMSYDWLRQVMSDYVALKGRGAIIS